MRLQSRRCAGIVLIVCAIACAQDRITGQPDPARSVRLSGYVHPMAQSQNDQGELEPSAEISMVTLLLKPSPRQQSALNQLLDDQQNASKPDYHRWLTPEQFADRFGATAADIAKIQSWLTAQGLQINNTARGHGWITFSGTAKNVGSAFHTEIHRYTVDNESHFANATEPSIPQAFESVIGGISGLNNFPLRSFRNPLLTEHPLFNSNGTHFLAPDDFATIYDIAPLYNEGIDGTGQSIAILGAGDVNLADLALFRTRFGLPVISPQLVLVGPDPGTNGATLEAALDLEWSGAIARSTSISYVYAQNVLTAGQYAVDQNLAAVISLSFGSCERETIPAYESVVQQANAQGITWIASSGDSGAADCDHSSYVSLATRGMSVNFPASLPEVTAVGGTTFNEGSGNFWASSNSLTGASATMYIPEVSWNDTQAFNRLSGTGGGASSYFPKPAWQQGSGVPADGMRDVPDVAFSASAAHDAYLIFNGGILSAIGGTSAPTPAFAGVVALLNHSLTKSEQGSGRLGNINATLYRLAQTTTDVFHDVTSGNNIVPCAPGSPNCATGSFGYSSGAGYDPVTGLGSMDVNRMVAEWTSAVSGTNLSVTASPASVNFYGGPMTLSAAVTGKGGIPTGSVSFVFHDATIGSANLANGSASVTINPAVLGIGNQTVIAIYSGDANFSSSSAAVSVTVAKPVGAAIVMTASPNPVYQQPPNSGGYTWFYTVQLSEVAGVAATLNNFTIDGSPLTLSGFFSTVNIPANGSISTTIESRNLTPPVNRVFAASGTDANGNMWSQQITIEFLAPTLLEPLLTLTSLPATVLKNPDPSAACPWLQELTVQELSGFTIDLTNLTVPPGSTGATIQQIFGTTRLAPFGSLTGQVCFTDVPVPASGTISGSFSVLGVNDRGNNEGASLQAAFGPAASTPATPSVSPTSVTMQVPNSSSVANATVNLAFGGAATAWTASIVPSNSATAWLTVAPITGAGGSNVVLQASAAGLENGVYFATLAIQAVNAMPQVINVPITFVVGTSSSVQIAAVLQGASFKPIFAPGMVMSVFGSNLAPAGSALQAQFLPLPLSLAGVSASVNGIPAPLYYVSPTQLNIQIPYEVGAGAAVVGVNNNGQVASLPFAVGVVAPGIFADGSGNLVPFNSGKVGDTLVLFETGDGDLTPTLPTGQTPSSSTPLASLPAPRMAASLTVAGMPAKIVFIGVPFGLAGVTQVNFTIPSGVAPGPQQVVLTVGGITSQAAMITVTQ